MVMWGMKIQLMEDRNNAMRSSPTLLNQAAAAERRRPWPSTEMQQMSSNRLIIVGQRYGDPHLQSSIGFAARKDGEWTIYSTAIKNGRAVAGSDEAKGYFSNFMIVAFARLEPLTVGPHSQAHHATCKITPLQMVAISKSAPLPHHNNQPLAEPVDYGLYTDLNTPPLLHQNLPSSVPNQGGKGVYHSPDQKENPFWVFCYAFEREADNTTTQPF
jgi:hypothetical protein